MTFPSIHFLVAAQKVFTCTEAEKCQPDLPDAPAHDAFTRLLQRQPPDPEALWQEARPLIQRHQGVLVVDDSTLSNPMPGRWRWLPAIGVASITGWSKASTC